MKLSHLLLLSFILILSCKKNNDQSPPPQLEADSILGDFQNYVQYGLPLKPGMHVIDTFTGRSLIFDESKIDSFNNKSPYLFRFNWLGGRPIIKMTKEIAMRYDSAKADYFPVSISDLHFKCICVTKGIRMLEPITFYVHRLETDRELETLNQSWNGSYWYIILNKRQFEEFNETPVQDPMLWYDCNKYFSN